MKYLFTIFIFCISIIAKSEECTFDQKEQLSKAKVVLSKNPGGRLEAKSASITWVGENYPANFYSYGGCEDIGLTIKKTINSNVRLKESEVAALARAMAATFISESVAAEVVSKFKKVEFTLDKEGQNKMYGFEIEGYSEFYVEYNVTKSYVAINAVENL